MPLLRDFPIAPTLSADDLDEIALRRGLVLLELQQLAPARLPFGRLERKLVPFYEGGTRELQRDLLFLEQLDCITHHEEDVNNELVVSYQIRPAGVLLVHGATSQAGIAFRRS